MQNRRLEPRNGGSRIKIVSRKDWKFSGIFGVLLRADGGLVNIQGGSDTPGVRVVILDCAVCDFRVCVLQQSVYKISHTCEVKRKKQHADLMALV